MDNKVRKNSIYSLLKAFSQVVFPLITFPYISRVLHAENVGKVNFANSIISYVSLAASLGITTYAVRECSKIKDDKNKLENMVGQIISFNMVTTFIAYIGLALALLAAKPLENYREMIIILSTTVLFTTLGADWLNTAMEDFKYITVRTFLFQLISIAAMLLFVRKPEDYMRYAVITVVASSGASITNMVYRRKFCKTKLTLNIDWKRHLPPVLLLFVMVLAQTIYCNSDITILGIIKGNYEVGLYSTSVKIYSLVNSTIASIAWVVMPQMTKNFNEGNYNEINKLFRYTFNFVVILGLPCVVGINILCPEIIEIIAGKEYLGATGSLHILSIALAISLIGGLIGNVLLLPAMEEKTCLIACVISAMANIILNILFIPKYGITAAAATTAVSELISLCIAISRADKKIKLIACRKDLAGPAIGVLLIILIGKGVAIVTENLWTKTVLTILLSILGYFIVLILTRNEFAKNMSEILFGKCRHKK